MKRYRVLGMEFDTAPGFLSMTIDPSWELAVQESHRANKSQIVQELIAEYGEQSAERKIQDYKDFGSIPFCILAYHNQFMRQVRTAFVSGAYYPALTGACALGERILNYLILNLREDFRATPQYRHVYRKDAFANWDLAINTLEAWNVLLPEVVTHFRKLHTLRNNSIHFDKTLEGRVRGAALDSIHTLVTIVSTQFSAFGAQPWFIRDAIGASFIAKAYESDPFVKRVYLCRCALVGPSHSIEFLGNAMRVVDSTYAERDITDDEFAALYNSRCSTGQNPAAT